MYVRTVYVSFIVLGNTSLLVRGFFPELGFFADFLYISLTWPGGNYIESDGGGGAVAAPRFMCI